MTGHPGQPRHRRLPKRRLKSFDWGPLVERGFFQGMITAYVGAGLGLILFDAQRMTAPPWLLIDARLSIVCAVLAFARVWKSIREENETSVQWDDVGQSGYDRILDRVVEIPYLFCLSVLPFAAIAPQGFMLTLFVFYLTDNFYNAGLARGAAGLDSPPGSSYPAALLTAFARSLGLWGLDKGDDNAMVEYFRVRSRYNSGLAAALAVSGVLLTYLHLNGSTTAALGVGFVVLVAILLVELFVEPQRNFDEDLWPHGGTVAVEDVRAAVDVPAAAADQLTRIHEDAFPPEEQQYTMAYMLGRAGRPDSILRIIRFEERIAGYLYLELFPPSVFLWYMAIDPALRDRGIGQLATRDTVEMLRREHPDLRYALFEVHRPSDRPDQEAQTIDRRRIAFYRRLGAHWIQGVDYQLPAAGNEEQSVAYEPMFFPLRDTFDVEEIRVAVRLMAADNFEDRPDDARWLSLQQSLAQLTIVPPSQVRVLGALPA